MGETKNLQPLKDKWARIKYVVGLCVLLLVLDHIGYFIKYFFNLLLDVSYGSLLAGITNIIIYATTIFIVIIVGLKDQNKTLSSVCFFKKVNGVVWFAAILCAVGYTLFSYYIHFLFYSFSYGWDTDLGEAGGNFFINLIDIAIIPAIAEELLMKGIIFPILKKHFSTIVAVVIASLLFAALHLSFIRIIPLFLLSCYTFWLYLKSGNLIIPMLLHFTNNLFSFVLISEPLAELGTFYMALVLLVAGTYLIYKNSGAKKPLNSL